MISNWNQIDAWVKSNYSKPLDKEILKAAYSDDKIAPFKSAFVIPNIKEREKEQASLRAKSKEIADNKWQSVLTVGDGTCLLHALLLSTSSTYRKIPPADRSAVGIAFRQGPILDLFSGIDDNGVRYPPSHILSKEYIRGSYNFLENEHIQILSQLLQLNFYIIVKQGDAVEGIQNYMSPGSPWIFTLCRNPNHYSSIYLGSQKKFMLTDKEFILLYPSINKESIDYVLKLPLYHLISSSDDPSKPVVRTNFLSTSLEDLEGKLNDYSDFLKINRDLMHDAYISSQRLRGNMNEIVRLRANVRRDEMAKSKELLSTSSPSSKEVSANDKMKKYIISKTRQTYERIIKKILKTEISKDILEKCDTLAGLQKGTLLALYNKTSGSSTDKKNAIISKLIEQLKNEVDEIQAMNYSKVSSRNIQSLILTYNKLLKNIQAGGTRKKMRKRYRNTRSR